MVLADNATLVTFPPFAHQLQERASLQQSQMSPFLSRQVPIEQLVGPASKKLEHLEQVQDFLGQEKQVGRPSTQPGRDFVMLEVC